MNIIRSRPKSCVHPKLIFFLGSSTQTDPLDSELNLKFFAAQQAQATGRTPCLATRTTSMKTCPETEKRPAHWLRTKFS